MGQVREHLKGISNFQVGIKPATSIMLFSGECAFCLYNELVFFLLQYFVKKFQSIIDSASSDTKQTSIAIRGYGYFAKVGKCASYKEPLALEEVTPSHNRKKGLVFYVAQKVIFLIYSKMFGDLSAVNAYI